MTGALKCCSSAAGSKGGSNRFSLLLHFCYNELSNGTRCCLADFLGFALIISMG